jgi:ADP-heptose:LPS heptosyltransferase
MITPLLQEIEATFPGCKVDIFAQGSLAPVVFKNYENVDRIIQLPVKPLSN